MIVNSKFYNIYNLRISQISWDMTLLTFFITGCWASLFPVILVDLLGIEVIEKSLGQCLAAGSIAFLVASPMSGEFPNNYKSVQTYDLHKIK